MTTYYFCVCELSIFSDAPHSLGNKSYHSMAKVYISKVEDYEVLNIKQWDGDIIEFNLDSKTLFDKYLTEFRTKNSIEGNKEIEFLLVRARCMGILPEKIESKLMENLHHIFQADKYFTNGQLVITMVQKVGVYYVRLPVEIFNFASCFAPHPALSQFISDRIPALKFMSYKKAELFILNQLSITKSKKVPVLNHQKISHVEIMSIYPNIRAFKIGDLEYQREEQNHNEVDNNNLQLIVDLKPAVLKCCRNCANFELIDVNVTEIGGKVTGICKLLKAESLLPNEIATQSLNWCGDFEVMK